MPLSDADRRAVWAAWMRAPVGAAAVTKQQLRAAVDAADDWADAHLAAFTAAMPEALRSPGPCNVLLGNAAAIAAGLEVPDVSAGVASRSQSADLLAAYNAAAGWLAANAAGYLTAVAQAGAGGLSQPQALSVLRAVCHRRGGL